MLFTPYIRTYVTTFGEVIAYNYEISGNLYT